MTYKMLLAVMLSALLIVGGCGRGDAKLPVSGEKMQLVTAPILNTEGNQIGEVSFTEEEDGVVIALAAEGLTPGTKGIHLHETGVCTPPDFTSAGSHFNPQKKEHGFENPKGFHLGDLPNIEVDAEGKVSAKMKNNEITLKSGADNSILDSDGSALVIHEKADDYKTDPSGNSGARIACAAVTK